MKWGGVFLVKKVEKGSAFGKNCKMGVFRKKVKNGGVFL